MPSARALIIAAGSFGSFAHAGNEAPAHRQELAALRPIAARSRSAASARCCSAARRGARRRPADRREGGSPRHWQSMYIGRTWAQRWTIGSGLRATADDTIRGCEHDRAAARCRADGGALARAFEGPLELSGRPRRAGEDAEANARRELFEETGLAVGRRRAARRIPSRAADPPFHHRICRARRRGRCRWRATMPRGRSSCRSNACSTAAADRRGARAGSPARMLAPRGLPQL